ncbi:MAG TPA: hypothetical protein VKE70_21130 [Candidatus Solibacter sp.]|jgi:hypothetical protein|nr:hypothetical protein [Candidatus Solibacter sp.]
MSGSKVEFDAALWARIQKHAAQAGYSDAAEFVIHAVEKELARTEPDSSDPKKLRGIGYLDAGLDI